VLYSPKSGSLALNHRKTYFGAIYLLQQLNHPKEPQKKHHLVFVYTLQCPDCQFNSVSTQIDPEKGAVILMLKLNEMSKEFSEASREWPRF